MIRFFIHHVIYQAKMLTVSDTILQVFLIGIFPIYSLKDTSYAWCKNDHLLSILHNNFVNRPCIKNQYKVFGPTVHRRQKCRKNESSPSKFLIDGVWTELSRKITWNCWFLLFLALPIVSILKICVFPFQHIYCIFSVLICWSFHILQLTKKLCRTLQLGSLLEQQYSMHDMHLVWDQCTP